MGDEREAEKPYTGRLDARVRDAVRRSEGVTVRPGGPAPAPAEQPPAGGPEPLPAAEREALAAEFRSLIRQLTGPGGTVEAADGESLLALCRARLGALVGARWNETLDEADRREAADLLRRAREGGRLDVARHTAAARDLLVLLAARFGVRRKLSVDVVRDIIEASLPEEHGGPGIIETAPEIERLVHELAAARGTGTPEGVPDFLGLMSDAHRALVSGDAGLLLDVMRRLDALDHRLLGPVAPLIRMLRTMMPTTAEGLPPGALRPPTGEEQQGIRTLLGLMMATAEPGAVSAQQLAELLAEAHAQDGATDRTTGPAAASPVTGTASGTGTGSDGPAAVEPGTAPAPAPPAPVPGFPGSTPVLAMVHALLASRTGDSGQYEEALRLLRRAAEENGDDEDFAWFVRGVLPGLLAGSSLTGGSRVDFAAARRLLEESLAAGTGPLVAGRPEGRRGADNLLRMNRYMLMMTELSEAVEARDVPVLEKVIGDVLDELDALEDPDGPGPATDLDARHLQLFMPQFLLCYGHLALTLATSDADALRRAAHYLDQAYAAAEPIPFVRNLMDALCAPLLALTSHLDPDPERVAAAVERARASLDSNQVVAGQRIRTRMGIAMALTLGSGFGRDRAVLDEAIAELEQARAELDGVTDQAASALLWDLAEGYARRAGRAPGADLDRAVADARDSLRATAADVLLQEGVRHGLEAARGGAARGLRAAAWAVRAGRPEEAVACLEAGRALVLGAAAVSATVPERLDALGEPELARAWREARPGGADPDAGAPGADPLLTALLDGSSGDPRLPSGLRRRALEVLRGQDDGRHGRVPDVAELREAVARSGAEALVYLLPGDDEGGGEGAAGEDGWALFVVPDRPPWALPLPALSGPGRAPVAAYLEATGGRSTARRGAERWEAALDALCAWAGDGVMGPVLDELGLWERGLTEAGLLPGAPAEPVRLALVACGNLGVVPWQAALVTVPDRWRAAGAPAAVRACETAVLTHAASGREFLRAVRARRLPLDRGQALVCVPADLDMAEDEVLAVHDAYYPGAALYGEFDTRPVAPPPPRGTPAEVLGLLGAHGAGGRPVAVVHLVCHGTAGDEPGSSVLELGHAPDAPPESGRLSVTRLLDTRPAPDGTGRPLVVLSACETDLSTRDHDEALTVTTAFAHGLAADAVGSRWQVSDDASAVLMTVFHHHVAAGLAPADALRAAQRWMLAPAASRPPVPGLTETLRRVAARPELTRPAFWGAFIHQGSPAPRPHHGEGAPTA